MTTFLAPRPSLRLLLLGVVLALGRVDADAARATSSRSAKSKAATAAAAAAATGTFLGRAHGEPAVATTGGANDLFDDTPFKAGDYRGNVTRVVDGDTLWVVLEGATKPIKVRIEGIDAPEVCQPFGVEAKQALVAKVLHRDVTLKLRALDDWGRRIGHVHDGETNIGQRMVRDGLAWSIRYRWDRGPYVPDERMAQSFRRGLFNEPLPMEPREFRRVHGSCKTDGPAIAAPVRGGGGNS